MTCICTRKNQDPLQEGVCLVPIEDSGLFWDGVCFAFLIIQRRLFSSHYFCHVINEAKASLILASRGNELIEELRVKEMHSESEREMQILQKIKMKMDRIKATQQRVLEENEPKHHAAGKNINGRHILIDRDFRRECFFTHKNCACEDILIFDIFKPYAVSKWISKGDEFVLTETFRFYSAFI